MCTLSGLRQASLTSSSVLGIEQRGVRPPTMLEERAMKTTIYTRADGRYVEISKVGRGWLIRYFFRDGVCYLSDHSGYRRKRAAVAQAAKDGFDHRVQMEMQATRYGYKMYTCACGKQLLEEAPDGICDRCFLHRQDALRFARDLLGMEEKTAQKYARIALKICQERTRYPWKVAALS
jgi:hypothetical protein